MLDHELEPEERSVRGSLVVGLSKADMSNLDVFEGCVGIALSNTKPFVPLIVPLWTGICQEDGSGPSPRDHRSTCSLRGSKALGSRLHRRKETRPNTFHTGSPPTESF